MLNANTWAFSSGHTLLPRRPKLLLLLPSPRTTTDTTTTIVVRCICTREIHKIRAYMRFTSIDQHTLGLDISFSRACECAEANGPRNFSGWLTRRDPRYSSAIVRFRAYTCPFAHVHHVRPALCVGCTCICTHVPALFWSTSTSITWRISNIYDLQSWKRSHAFNGILKILEEKRERISEFSQVYIAIIINCLSFCYLFFLNYGILFA